MNDYAQAKALEQLKADIQSILYWVWDPLGLAVTAPKNEYSSYIGPLVWQVSRGMDSFTLYLWLLDTAVNDMEVKVNSCRDTTRRASILLERLGREWKLAGYRPAGEVNDEPQ